MSTTLNDLARKLVASVMAATVLVSQGDASNDTAQAADGPLDDATPYSTQLARRQRQAMFDRRVAVAVEALYKAYELGKATTAIGRLQADVDPQALADVRYEVTVHPKSDSLWLTKKSVQGVLAALDHANAVISDMAHDGLLAIQQAAYAHGKADGVRKATSAAIVCLYDDEALNAITTTDVITDVVARMEKAIEETAGASNGPG